MTESDRQRLTRRADILKSLAHPSRLLIIEMLENSPRCVGELTEAVGADITTVSKHLAVMKRVGLVRTVKQGTYSQYSIVCDCVTHLIDCIEVGIKDQPAVLAEMISATQPKTACASMHRTA